MTVTILNGDCRDVLKTMPDESVHCVVTSPPYWGLRDYGVPSQIGLEQTPQEFVSEMVAVFGEVRRVLRSDGTLWFNMGDCYANDGKFGGKTGGKQAYLDEPSLLRNGREKRVIGLKPKDLVGMPWRCAFALQSDGWWLRSANIWAKANGMPESTRDRPVVAHEYVFQLSRSERYFYDYESVKLPPVPDSVARLARSMRQNLDGPDDPEASGFVVSGGGYAPPGQAPHQGARRSDKQRGHTRRHAGFNDRWDAMSVAEQQANGAAVRSVWWIAPSGFADSHFAVMPQELAALCILAGCPAGGTVLDPFGGAGTTGMVADRLGRNAILIELNPEYAAMAERRIKGDAGMFAEVNR